MKQTSETESRNQLGLPHKTLVIAGLGPGRTHARKGIKSGIDVTLRSIADSANHEDVNPQRQVEAHDLVAAGGGGRKISLSQYKSLGKEYRSC
ncbi:MAG: hypothetical protein QGI86_14140 [Candidatus Poribacteria bacterium]|nr:hypothetical protein [Candidatus Poribacteria bacterium]MDP6961107.1 hypothetical protein [Dehalococcoidia bacterium]